MLQCLNLHTHGVAISNHRLVCLRYADWSAGVSKLDMSDCGTRDILSSNFQQTKGVPHDGRLVRFGTPVASAPVLELSRRVLRCSPV